MLDSAFAIGHGRAVKQDRARAVETYLKAMAQSAGEDAVLAADPAERGRAGSPSC
jgi:hypothetical protein